MPKSIERFEVSEDGFTLPAEEILTGRGFVTGKSGSGKSNTASVIIEELLDRNLGLLIVDTDGEYVGLKAEYDLLHVGAGSECDLEVSDQDADQLGSYALEDRVPILLDLSTYADEEEAESILYETVNALFVAEGEHRIPFLIVLEEAHEFLPQGGSPAGSELKSLLIRVAKRGRKRGLGICCLSQRPASVDKDYITQCDWFVWHRLTWENDTAVVGRILGGDSENCVQSLSDGEAIVQTDWDEVTERVQFRRKRTADAGSTPSLDDLDVQFGVDAGGSRGKTSTTETVDSPEDGNAGSGEGGIESSGTDGGASTITVDSTSGDEFDTALVNYDETAISAPSNSNRRRKPSLDRRRRRHRTPEKRADPFWEIGAIVVYLYDTLVWYHLTVVDALELMVTEATIRTDESRVERERPRRSGRYERYAYRTLAVLCIVAAYAIVVFTLIHLI